MIRGRRPDAARRLVEVGAGSGAGRQADQTQTASAVGGRPSAVGGRGQGASARRKSSGRRKQEAKAINQANGRRTNAAVAARREASVPLLAFWVAGPVRSTPGRLGWACGCGDLGRIIRPMGGSSDPGNFPAIRSQNFLMMV